MADAGIIMLRCTLSRNHEGRHYDAIFSREWTEA